MILGIDPGLSGAFAVLDPSTRKIVHYGIIPTIRVTRNKKQKTTVDLPCLVAAMRRIAELFKKVHAVIEFVGAMPGQGVSSMFSFGYTTGTIDMAVTAAGIPYVKVPPGVWKRALVCPADKDGALARATELMPADAEYWTPRRGVRTKEQCKGIAEAALIAFYGANRAVDMSLLAA